MTCLDQWFKEDPQTDGLLVYCFHMQRATSKAGELFSPTWHSGERTMEAHSALPAVPQQNSLTSELSARLLCNRHRHWQIFITVANGTYWKIVHHRTVAPMQVNLIWSIYLFFMDATLKKGNFFNQSPET